MPTKKHHIKLDLEERHQLESLSRKQKAAAIKVKRAKAMLAMDCGPHGPAHSDPEAAGISGLAIASLQRLRKRVCEVGPIGALERQVRETPPVAPKVTGEVEARMVQIACSQPPEGRESWTMQMIADRLVELKLVQSISDETVRLTLKKTTLNLGNRSAGASRPKRTPLS
jgi:Homeodomain-like domain